MNYRAWASQTCATCGETPQGISVEMKREQWDRKKMTGTFTPGKNRVTWYPCGHRLTVDQSASILKDQEAV